MIKDIVEELLKYIKTEYIRHNYPEHCVRKDIEKILNSHITPVIENYEMQLLDLKEQLSND